MRLLAAWRVGGGQAKAARFAAACWLGAGVATASSCAGGRAAAAGGSGHNVSRALGFVFNVFFTI